MTKVKTLLLVLILPLFSGLTAQPRPPLRVTLVDGHEVGLYRQANLNGITGNYLHTPFNLRLAERDGEPEFTFLAYREDSTTAIIGGILHFLLTWGPTDAQGRELRSLLRMRTDTSNQLMGSLMLVPDTSEAELEIGPPDHPLAQLLMRSLNSVAMPPTSPGGKMAASFHFSAEDAQLVAETISSPEDWKEVYLRIHLKTFGRGYQPLPPASFTLTKSFAACLESL